MRLTGFLHFAVRIGVSPIVIDSVELTENRPTTDREETFTSGEYA
ncbi:MAG: hypothetical protein JWL97_810 [Gemmatimonadales bacterium]|jgi:hypothetical protein|nr:hypothetical protein [Gemmatimonadales bacterium]